MSNKLNKIRKQLSYTFSTMRESEEMVEIGKIPLKWTKFSEDGDKWVKVVFPSSVDTSACMYSAPKGKVFKSHYHPNREQCTITNEGGKLKLYTEHGVKTLSFPESFSIPANEKHKLVFLEQTDLLCMWHPEFANNWEAVFEE